MPEQSDHDIIIRLDTKLDLLTQKVDDMSTNATSRIEKLEALGIKLEQTARENTKATSDHEARIRVMESSMNQGKGGERIIQAIISIVAAGTIGLIIRLLTKH